MQTIKVKNGADINIYTDDGVGIIVVRPNPEQLPPPAPQDVQPEGQRVGEWAEARVLAMPMFGKSAHVFQGPIRDSLEDASTDMVDWRRGMNLRRAEGEGVGGAEEVDVATAERTFRSELVWNQLHEPVADRLWHAARAWVLAAIRDATAIGEFAQPRSPARIAFDTARREEPVAAGAPLGGAGDEELTKRFWKIYHGIDVKSGNLAAQNAAVQLAREAVAAERERCAQIVLDRPMSGEMSGVFDKIRSGQG